MITILSSSAANACSILHASCFEKKWSENDFLNFFDNASIMIWGYWHNNMLVGLLCLATFIDESEIYTLCVHPDYREKKIASALLRHAFNACNECLIHTVHIEVSSINDAALAFYKKHHFQQISIRKNYYQTQNGSQDAIIMHHILNDD